MSEERDLQNANVSAMSDQISSVTEERDLLQADLTEMTKELERLQSLFNQSESLYELFCGSCFSIRGWYFPWLCIFSVRSFFL